MDQVEPVGADVRDRSQFAAVFREDSPVEIGFVEQPVLKITAGDVVNIADDSVAHSVSRFEAQWVVTYVVIDSANDV